MSSEESMPINKSFMQNNKNKIIIGVGAIILIIASILIYNFYPNYITNIISEKKNKYFDKIVKTNDSDIVNTENKENTSDALVETTTTS